MNRAQIEQILIKSWEKLKADQPDFGRFGVDTSQHELNIAHHYANYVFQYLGDASTNLSCDFDVLKSNIGKRPDIIFHERGTNDNNLLVLELKLNGRHIQATHELKRIQEDWFGIFHYKFGAYLNIDRLSLELLDIQVLKNSVQD